MATWFTPQDVTNIYHWCHRCSKEPKSQTSAHPRGNLATMQGREACRELGVKRRMCASRAHQNAKPCNLGLRMSQELLGF
jgi:hypothetical protein